MLNEEKRQELIEYCELLKMASDPNYALIAEIALACLEAEPAEKQYYYHNHGTGSGQWTKVESMECFEQMKATHAGDNDFSFRDLYTAPPVPVMQSVELPQSFSPDLSVFGADARCVMRADKKGRWVNLAAVELAIRAAGGEVK